MTKFFAHLNRSRVVIGHGRQKNGAIAVGLARLRKWPPTQSNSSAVIWLICLLIDGLWRHDSLHGLIGVVGALTAVVAKAAFGRQRRGRNTVFARKSAYIMLLLVFLLAVLLYGRVYLGGWLDATLQKNLHTLMCERLLILPMARLGDESMGALTTRIMSFVPP